MAAAGLMCNLSGKVALITGASSGIGAATAVLFARLGAKLAIMGRNEANLLDVSKNCSQHLTAGTESPLMLIGDLTSEHDVKRIVDKTVERFGRLDILVNNAGVLEFGSIETTSLEQYDRVMNVNVRAVYQLTMLAVPHLIKTQGSIVNVSSVNGTRSFSGVLAYCISKSAVDQLTKCTALELASKKVRVNSVNPGVVVTDLQKRGGLTDDAYAKFLERSKETHALGRPGETEEVARAIAFLASDEASFITGENLHVDGGRHAMCPR
jgi:NAD(P)-dependent dehydrogenase (short-subunit alcohol dehydrogenase family)